MSSKNRGTKKGRRSFKVRHRYLMQWNCPDCGATLSEPWYRPYYERDNIRHRPTYGEPCTACYRATHPKKKRRARGGMAQRPSTLRL